MKYKPRFIVFGLTNRLQITHGIRKYTHPKFLNPFYLINAVSLRVHISVIK